MKNKNKFSKKLKKSKLGKRFLNIFSKNKRKRKQKARTKLFLAIIFVVLSLFLIVRQLNNLLLEEAQNDYQNIQKEVGLLTDSVSVLENQLFESALEEENKEILAEKIRELNYRNLHLLKLINAYDNDWSLQFFQKGRLVELDVFFEETRNVYLASIRVTNKFDAFLLLEELNEEQINLIKKDLELFYQKTKLILTFSF